ncbi:MAG: outer membrane lipoprotein-sorting protein [Verrucomicrobiales bacterium]|nr:outer membrane lipoprotein-sorting protein [Verrucomicrobiales bacterium]
MKKLLFTVSFLTLSTLLTHGQDAALLAAEKARGIMTGNTGVQWTVNVSGAKSAQFLATAKGGTIHAEVIQPADAAGRKYIAEAKGAMWFWKPGLSRPVSVSKKQRLSGDAAIGDIASTSFVEGYKVVGKEDGDVNGEAATVYTMKANSLGDTYAQIKYWVTKSGNLGKKAEFYAKSGNLLRTSTMEYKNTVNGSPFLSRMVIRDSSRTINLSFSNVSIGNFPDSMFDKNNIGGKTFKGPRK